LLKTGFFRQVRGAENTKEDDSRQCFITHFTKNVGNVMRTTYTKANKEGSSKSQVLPFLQASKKKKKSVCGIECGMFKCRYIALPQPFSQAQGSSNPTPSSNVYQLQLFVRYSHGGRKSSSFS
jgi:hypothetical protein